MENMLLKQLSEKCGVQLKVRNKEEWMDESLDIRAKAIAKETAKYQNRQAIARDAEAINQEEAMDKMYNRGNKVD